MPYKDNKFLCFKWKSHTHNWQEEGRDFGSGNTYSPPITGSKLLAQKPITKIYYHCPECNERCSETIEGFIERKNPMAKTKEREQVELIASGYEWGCPNCEHNNNEIEVTQTVKCKQCGNKYDVADYEHAIE